MTPKMKDYLKIKLAETCVYMRKTEGDKKASGTAFSIEIKGAKQRINVISRAIFSDNVEELVDTYGVEYVESLEEYAERL